MNVFSPEFGILDKQFLTRRCADNFPSEGRITPPPHATAPPSTTPLIRRLHDRANIEQLARRSVVISMLIRRAGGL